MSDQLASDEVTSAVFIDMPNIDYLNHDHHPVNWALLVEQIDRDDIEGTIPVHAGAYASVHSDSNALAGMLTRLKRQFYKLGFDVESRQGKDIDSWIINDIWMSVGKTQQAIIERDEVLHLPFRMRHILVSGDGGYMRAYRSLAQTYEEDLEIELVVYSWRNQLHRDLEARASKVVYLDDLEGFGSMSAYLSRRHHF